MTRREYLPPTSRQLQTLAGPVRYTDSGWTEAEWHIIEQAMARCTGGTGIAPKKDAP